jgi:hypothetical protein
MACLEPMTLCKKAQVPDDYYQGLASYVLVKIGFAA